MMKHADELVRTSDPWTNAQTDLLTVMIFFIKKWLILAYHCTWHNTAEYISIMCQC